MATSERVSLTTTPTRISAQESTPNGQSVGFINDTGVSVLVGGDDCDTTGISIPSGGQWSADLEGGEEVYACVASGTATLAVMRLGAR